MYVFHQFVSFSVLMKCRSFRLWTSLLPREKHILSPTPIHASRRFGHSTNSLARRFKKRQYELLIIEAEGVEIGCAVHFERSLLRVRLGKTAAIVNPDLAPRFENLIRILRGTNTSITDFDEARQALLHEFSH